MLAQMFPCPVVDMPTLRRERSHIGCVSNAAEFGTCSKRINRGGEVAAAEEVEVHEITEQLMKRYLLAPTGA